MKFTDSVCLITGASSGIGRAIAEALHQQGVRLILVGRNDAKLSQLQSDLGTQHQVLVADINSASGRQAIANKVETDKAINLVVQCAGTSSFGEFVTDDPSAISDTLNTNLLAPMLITRELLPALLQRQQATIVNVGSVFGHIGFPCYSTYCASKFGLRGFSEALNRELADTNVNVLYFSPRGTRTDFNSEQVVAMNQKLGNKMDSPEVVARGLLKMLRKNKIRKVIGWPEKLFCRINGLAPGLVDKALEKQQPIVKRYAKTQHKQGA